MAIINHTARGWLPTRPALRVGQRLWWELLTVLIGLLSGGGRSCFSLVFALAAASPSQGGQHASWSGWLRGQPGPKFILVLQMEK